ncbi:MAG: hypothetical protein RIQ54_433 [Candidatus Parcubacteria bacterium]|jgi:alkyl hydroperoxide reductase subunit F
MYDLVIIGAGPAGCAAGVYAARKKIKTALITESFGGQSITSMDIQNWIGETTISGFDLAKKMEQHLKNYPEIDLHEGDSVIEIKKQTDGTFSITTKLGKALQTKYIMLATGSRRRKLAIPGEKEFDGRGVVYCATCDAPLFKDKEVVVVGGGNAALEAVVDLFHYAKKIYVAVRSTTLRGDEVTQEKVERHPNVEILYNTELQEIKGTGSVQSVVIKNNQTDATSTLAVQGVFIEIGAVPNSEIVKGLVEINGAGEVVVDHRTQASSDPMVFAAGDVSDVLYKQNNISAGDAIKAVLSIEAKVHKGK